MGLSPAREAAAYFLARRFLLARDGGQSTLSPPDPNLTDEETAQRIDPQNVAIGSGCTSLLGHLFLALAEQGDAVLIPLPFYAAFEKDMKVGIYIYICIRIHLLLYLKITVFDQK